MCDPQTTGARMTDSGLAMVSPYSDIVSTIPSASFRTCAPPQRRFNALATNAGEICMGLWVLGKAHPPGAFCDAGGRRWSDRCGLGHQGPFASGVATAFPNVLNGYMSIKARMRSTGGRKGMNGHTIGIDISKAQELSNSNSHYGCWSNATKVIPAISGANKA